MQPHQRVYVLLQVPGVVGDDERQTWIAGEDPMEEGEGVLPSPAAGVVVAADRHHSRDTVVLQRLEGRSHHRGVE